MGIGYVLGELPNSFVKRQLDITPGKTGGGPLGALFFLVDQADSILGSFLVGWIVWVPPLRVAAAIVLWLTALHIVLNVLLYLARVRRNVRANRTPATGPRSKRGRRRRSAMPRVDFDIWAPDQDDIGPAPRTPAAPRCRCPGSARGEARSRSFPSSWSPRTRAGASCG